MRPRPRPTRGRTAVEEAGIDIEPPPGDLKDEADPELTGDLPLEDSVPERVEEAVIEGAEAVDDVEVREADTLKPPVFVTVVHQASDSEPEIVTWDSAQDRLEYEREAERAEPDSESTV